MLVCALVGLTGWRAHQYVQAWQSDLTLWAWAAEGSSKPRVWVNLGGALALDHQWANAAICWRQALSAAELPSVPVWDRQTAGTIANADLLSLRLNHLIP